MGRFSLLAAATTVITLFLTLRLMLNHGSDYGSDAWQEAAVAKKPHELGRYEYEIVQDIFAPSVNRTDADTYDYLRSDLGLIKREYESDSAKDVEDSKVTQWMRLQRYVNHLNSKSSKNVQYKVLFLGRHGEGWHNVAEAKYGTKSWESKWALLEGDDTLFWADAKLTPEGEGQAKAAQGFLAEAEGRGQPRPDSYYTSPLSRCLQTAMLTFDELDLPSSKAFAPVVKELLREAIGRHTCDRRSSLAELQAAFPAKFLAPFKFENGFSDKDVLWTPKERETDEEMQARVRKLLDDVFKHDGGTWISMTSHSGAIGAMLAVLGHREFGLEPGSVMAVLVRAQRG